MGTSYVVFCCPATGINVFILDNRPGLPRIGGIRFTITLVFFATIVLSSVYSDKLEEMPCKVLGTVEVVGGLNYRAIYYIRCPIWEEKIKE